MEAVPCAACCADVGPAALYVLGAGAAARTFCAACAKATHPEWERCGLAVKHTACRRCGRKRYYQGRGLWPHAYCTEGCARHARRERRRRGRTRREGACRTCGQRFTATRPDARYCSPACRQQAYRERNSL